MHTYARYKTLRAVQNLLDVKELNKQNFKSTIIIILIHDPTVPRPNLLFQYHPAPSKKSIWSKSIPTNLET